MKSTRRIFSLLALFCATSVWAQADYPSKPIKLIGVGEGVEDLQPFDARAFSRSLVGLED